MSALTRGTGFPQRLAERAMVLAQAVASPHTSQLSEHVYRLGNILAE